MVVVIYGEHVRGNVLAALGPESEERNKVAVSTYCEVRGKFVYKGTGGGGKSEHANMKRHSRGEVEVHLGI